MIRTATSPEDFDAFGDIVTAYVGWCRGQGVGRKLCAALLDAARADGYALMRLDTGNLLREAIAMHASFGFTYADPHHVYPDAFLPYLVFMERALDDAPPTTSRASSTA